MLNLSKIVKLVVFVFFSNLLWWKFIFHADLNLFKVLYEEGLTFLPNFLGLSLLESGHHVGNLVLKGFFKQSKVEFFSS